MVDARRRSDAEGIRSAISGEIARQLAAAGVGPPAGQQGAQAGTQQAAPSVAAAGPVAAPVPVAEAAVQ
eukprot:12658575-Alexandrium_andersonii.AAC.1